MTLGVVCSVEGIKDNNMSSELHDDDYDEEEGALFGIDIDAGTEKLQENFNQLRGTDYATIMATADAQWMKGGERGGKDEENKTKGAWKAENIVTAFGMTDDIVNLKNGQKYYFFKLPHKVNNNSNHALLYICIYIYICIHVYVLGWS